MSSKRLLGLFLVLPLVAVVCVAGLAQAHEDEAYPRLYVGLAFAAALEQFEGTEGFSSFDEAIGVDGWIGVRVTHGLGIEGQFTYLDGFDTEFLNVPVEVEAFSVTGNLKLYPLDGWFQPFVVGGIGVARYDVEALGVSIDRSGRVYRAGGGLDLNFAGGFSVVAGGSYLFTTGDINDSDIIEVKLGIQHMF